MLTTSPSCKVKSLPGTKQVPVIRKLPCGKSHSRYKKPASSGNVRFILPIVVSSLYTSVSLRLIFILMAVSNETGSSGTYKHGPKAALRSYVLPR